MNGGIIYNGIAYHFDGREPTELIQNQDGTMTPKSTKCDFCAEFCGNDWCCVKEKDE